MSHEKWDDKKIEELLSNAPKIQDTRSKDEIFQRLKNDGVFNEEPSNQPTIVKKKKYHWIPITVSLAAILLVAILIPSFVNQMNNTENASTANEESTELSDQANRLAVPENSLDASQSNQMLFSAKSVDLKNAVYPDQIEGNTVFHIGLASEAADSVPVTVLIPNEKIMEDFGKSNPTEVELYNQYAPLIDESAIGFDEFHPYVGEISEDANQVIHKLPSNPPYDMGTASMDMYLASLIDTFHSYEEIVLLNEDNTPFTFSEVGVPSEPIKTHSENTQYNYFKYTQSDGSVYLVPNFRQSYLTIEEALDAMKTESNDIYQSVILPKIDFTSKVNNNIVTVTFNTEVDLLNYDQQEAMRMIEGILLTASSFDLQVQFENIVQTEWEGFDFNNPLPIPVGPNELPYTIIQ